MFHVEQVVAAVLLGTLFTLSWDPVTTNCDGGPEAVDFYEVPLFAARIVGWETCMVEGGDPYPCPVYNRNVVLVDTTDTSVSTPDPDIGEVIGYEWPRAIDRAGNSSEFCPNAPEVQ